MQPLSTEDAGPGQPLLLLLQVRAHLPQGRQAGLAELTVEHRVLLPHVHGQGYARCAGRVTGGAGEGAGVGGEGSLSAGAGGAGRGPGQVLEEEVARRLGGGEVEVGAPGARAQVALRLPPVPVLALQAEAGPGGQGQVQAGV